jgi:hypothetical protein
MYMEVSGESRKLETLYLTPEAALPPLSGAASQMMKSPRHP